jgi:hypothetical protein
MSGPIVRKYGFPNFDKIFGKRELEHGVDEPPSPPAGESKETGPATGSRPEDAPKPAEPGNPRP